MGFPAILQSDNGSEFVNDVIRALTKELMISHRFSSAYNPRANGKVERMVKTVKLAVNKLMLGADIFWPLYAKVVQYQINVVISNTTGYSPFVLMFGRSPLPLVPFTNAELPDYTQAELDRWLTQQDNIISILFPDAVAKHSIYKDRMKTYLNKKRKLIKSGYFPADSVVNIIDIHRSSKAEPVYVGPYIIVRRTRGGAYLIKDDLGNIIDRHIPPDQIKLVSHASSNELANQQSYEVERIIGHKGVYPNIKYHVKWLNYPEEESTYEPITSFNDLRVISDYWRELERLNVNPKIRSYSLVD